MVGTRRLLRPYVVSPGVWLALLLHAAPISAQQVRVTSGGVPVDVGGVARLTIEAPATADTVTVSAFGQSWPTLRRGRSAWTALIGVDLDREAGSYPVTVLAQGSALPAAEGDATLRVAARQFRRRVLTVAPEYVNPPPDLADRILAESQFLEQVYASSAPDAAWANGFVRPVPGRANSSFGTRSVFNGEERSPHAGTDFLSGTGTPIQAPAGGRIVAARDLFFSGRTVIIDHGLGVFSMLAHLSRIDVREGEAIGRGDIVGLVGATGRVTGPHLHWAMRVNGARVDPLSALRQLPGAHAEVPQQDRQVRRGAGGGTASRRR